MSARGLGQHLLQVLERTLELGNDQPDESRLQDLREMLRDDSARVEAMRPCFDEWTPVEIVHADLAFEEACDYFQLAIDRLLAVIDGDVDQADEVRRAVGDSDEALQRAQSMTMALALVR